MHVPNGDVAVAGGGEEFGLGFKDDSQLPSHAGWISASAFSQVSSGYALFGRQAIKTWIRMGYEKATGRLYSRPFSKNG